MKNHKKAQKLQELPLAAGTFGSARSTHMTAYRSLLFVFALAMAGSVFAQRGANSDQTLSSMQKPHQNKLPGERLTVQQRQALEAYGRDVSIEFGDQEVPSSITGRLSARTHPDDPATEAQSALDLHGAAFRRGPNDGFTFSAVDPDKTGMQHVRMNQTYKGIPVVNGELTVHLSRDQVTGISGRFVPDLELPTELTGGSSVQAAASALSFAEKQRYQHAQVVRTRSPVVFVDNENAGYLAIPVEVTHADADGDDQDDVFVDASSGQVLGRHALTSITPPCPIGQICTSTQLLRNPSFESGNDGSWYADAGVIGNWGSLCYYGTWCAYLDGYQTYKADFMKQNVTIPSTANSATLSFYLKMWTAETSKYVALDILKVSINTTCALAVTTTGGVCLSEGNSGLALLVTYSNVSALNWPFSNGNYVRQSFDVTKFKGATMDLEFFAIQTGSLQTSFVVDNILLTVQ